MDDFLVYILYSPSNNRLYIGYTTDLINRFLSHQYLGKEYTSKFRPWVVVHLEYFQSKNEAMRREKNLKGGQGRQWIKHNLHFINQKYWIVIARD